MKKKDQRVLDLYEAFALVVIRHTHELFGEDQEQGSLAPLQATLGRALGHTEDGPMIASWWLEQLGRQVREALHQPWGAGDAASREAALLKVVANDLEPVIDGRRGLARRAALLLGVLLEREQDTKALAARLR